MTNAKYQVLVTDSSGASLSSSTSFTATAQNMSMPTSHNTPNAGGIYCAVVNLYSITNVQLMETATVSHLLLMTITMVFQMSMTFVQTPALAQWLIPTVVNPLREIPTVMVTTT